MVLNIRVLTPDRVICSTTADEVVLPGLTGQVGVLDGHAALITALDTGLLRIKLDDKWTPIILCGGLAEIFTGSPGKYVSLEETIKGFTMVLNGELDDLPEQAFYLVGNIDEAIEKAETLK